jgi:hypothetical protein
MNLEPWIPAITAALTLVNTVILVWNQRHFAQLRENVNGMKYQLLAEAEQRGRRQVLNPEIELTDPPLPSMSHPADPV